MIDALSCSAALDASDGAIMILKRRIGGAYQTGGHPLYCWG